MNLHGCRRLLLLSRSEFRLGPLRLLAGDSAQSKTKTDGENQSSELDRAHRELTSIRGVIDRQAAGAVGR
ncbi:hypothetical protein AKJ09_07422 [Labilithrix luteola]|uniref:Uncharacterized protein n=1 Tax=Labilithrix luteola TaxID=1391654 RepID=A0A0K1Q4X0_9BACT|nr:hypothetical protein AKJ09_07422 [Labilithrix luteola]